MSSEQLQRLLFLMPNKELDAKRALKRAPGMFKKEGAKQLG